MAADVVSIRNRWRAAQPPRSEREEFLRLILLAYRLLNEETRVRGAVIRRPLVAEMERVLKAEGRIS